MYVNPGQTVELDPGTYRVSARATLASGYECELPAQTVTVEAGETSEVYFEFPAEQQPVEEEGYAYIEVYTDKPCQVWIFREVWMPAMVPHLLHNKYVDRHEVFKVPTGKYEVWAVYSVLMPLLQPAAVAKRTVWLTKPGMKAVLKFTHAAAAWPEGAPEPDGWPPSAEGENPDYGQFMEAIENLGQWLKNAATWIGKRMEDLGDQLVDAWEKGDWERYADLRERVILLAVGAMLLADDVAGFAPDDAIAAALITAALTGTALEIPAVRQAVFGYLDQLYMQMQALPPTGKLLQVAAALGVATQKHVAGKISNAYSSLVMASQSKDEMERAKQLLLDVQVELVTYTALAGALKPSWLEKLKREGLWTPVKKAWERLKKAVDFEETGKATYTRETFTCWKRTPPLSSLNHGITRST